MKGLYTNKVAWCYICNQGWIEIVKDLKTGKLFCCCSECENEWDNPECINEKNANTTKKYGRTSDVSDEEIDSIGWRKYILKD